MDKIDLITQKPDGTVVLVMVEERPWDGSRARLEELQARVNNYVSFALDGQLVQRFPMVEGQAVEIRLDCSEEPDSISRDFLSKLRDKLEEFNVMLEVNVP